MRVHFIAIASLALLVGGISSSAQAARCASGANGAACAGPNGAVARGNNGGRAATTNNNVVHTNAQAGTSVTGARGNTATKALAPGCAWVNGQRVCH
jgi:hypothetical protein